MISVSLEIVFRPPGDTYTYGKFLKTKVWSNFGLRFFLWTLVSYFGFLSGRR